MRTALPLVLLATACTANTPAGEPTYTSVRDRLGDESTRLVVARDGSTGVVTARRWTQGGWIEGDTPLAIDSGELTAALDGRGALALSTFEVGIAPIAIPDEVFGKPAELTDVKLTLTAPATGALTWSGDDAATARVPLALDLAWSIHVDGGKTPLGTQHLPAIDIDVALEGDGETIDATIGLAAAGELWSWAGLLEMTKLSLALDATTN